MASRCLLVAEGDDKKPLILLRANRWEHHHLGNCGTCNGCPTASVGNSLRLAAARSITNVVEAVKGSVALQDNTAALNLAACC